MSDGHNPGSPGSPATGESHAGEPRTRDTETIVVPRFRGMHRYHLLALGIGLAGCEAAGIHEDLPSWEEFRDAAPYIEYSGGRQYLVEGDLPIGDASALHEYYRELREGWDLDDDYRSAANVLDDDALDRWPFPTHTQLTYCVSTEFIDVNVPGEPDPYEAAVAYMAYATAQWEAIANVDFAYVPDEDADCDHENPDVVFSVRHIAGSANGCAFYPNDTTHKEPCRPDLGIVPTLWLGVGGLVDDGRATVHELGHLLGLRHERAHPDRPAWCNPDGEPPGYVTPLTDFDIRSTMLVPHGDCRDPDLEWDYSKPSAHDGIGARVLYGMPVSWYVGAGVF